MRHLSRGMKLILLIPIGIAAIVLFAFIGGQIVELLWNWLLPPLFGWPQIGFWQALGLLALCRILFGGHGGGRSGGMGRRTSDRVADRIAERIAERVGAMTPEERERVRTRIRERFGLGPEHPEHPEHS